jgi:hypothetical protein
MFVIARKGKGSSAYAEFASIGRMMLVGADGGTEDVKWIADRMDPRVTLILPHQRRGILTLFARHPKVFERCDLVELSSL